MVKRISWIVLAALFGMMAVTLCHPDFARAGTYKLEYPQGYGTCCPPNTVEFGYFRTAWREWPCEIRRDKTFPRSIGMEAIPAPEGKAIIPPPRVPAVQIPQGGAQPPQGPEGNITPPQEGFPLPGGQQAPGEMPTEPGKEAPAFPGLPQEPGGFNPLPGLPPDLGTPTTPNPNEKEENNPSAEPKQESEPKDESQEKNKTDDVPTPDSKQDDKGARIKSPSNTLSLKASSLDPIKKSSGTTGSLGPVKQSSETGGRKADQAAVLQPSGHVEAVRAAPMYSSNVARETTYHEPVESPTTARLSRDVVPQSYQQPSDSNEATVVVQSELRLDEPAAELHGDAPILALDGFCPVELSLHGRWTQGDPRWTVVHKGFIYRFSGNTQRQEFLTNPGKYIPANGGFDPVISVAEKRNVSGQVNFCAAYKGRLYMFSSATTQESFHKNPELYMGGAMK